MGNSNSSPSNHDLQMSCPDFIIDDRAAQRLKMARKELDSQSAYQEFNLQHTRQESNVQNSNHFMANCENINLENLSSINGNSLSLGLGSDSFNSSDYFRDVIPVDSLGDHSLPVTGPSSINAINSPQNLERQKQKSKCLGGGNYHLGFSDRQFEAYSRATEHSKHHHYNISFDDSLQQSYSALIPSCGNSQFQQEMDHSRNQIIDTGQVEETFKKNNNHVIPQIPNYTDGLGQGRNKFHNGYDSPNMPQNEQSLSQNRYNSNEMNSLNHNLQSYGFVARPQDSKQFPSNLPSSRGFVLSSNNEISCSSSQSSSNNFVPRNIDMSRYNDFFGGGKSSSTFSDNVSPVSRESNSKEKSDLYSQADRNSKLELLPGSAGSPQHVEKYVRPLSSIVSGCEMSNCSSYGEPGSTLTSEPISMVGYCSLFGGDTLSYIRVNDGNIWTDTGEFEPNSIDPDQSSQQHNESQTSAKDFQHQHSETNMCGDISENNTNSYSIDGGKYSDGNGRRVLRTCSGYSSCSNNEEVEEGVLSLPDDGFPSLPHESCDDSGRHNSCVSSDSQYEFVNVEGSRQYQNIKDHQNIKDGKEDRDLENNDDSENLPEAVEDKRADCAMDSFKKIEDEELTKCCVSDALCIYDGITKNPVMFSALMCVAPVDIDLFAMSFLSTLKKWGIRIFLPIRDLNPTGPYHENLTRVIKERCNGKIIVIVSKDYPQSDECLFLTYFAKTLDPAADKRNIIPIYIDKNIPNVPNVLKGLSSIPYNQAVRTNFLRTRLLSALDLGVTSKES